MYILKFFKYESRDIYSFIVFNKTFMYFIHYN